MRKPITRFLTRDCIGKALKAVVREFLGQPYPEMEIKAKAKSGEIRIWMQPLNEKEVELSVSDNGIGLPENLDFRKTNSLGLHLVTLLAENQLHGNIHYERNGGTQFYIRLKIKK